MIKSKFCLLLALALTSTSAIADQSRFLGKAPNNDEVKSEPVLQRVNLLKEDIIRKNPHYLNHSFWMNGDLNSIIKSQSITQESPKELSETILELMMDSAESFNDKGVEYDSDGLKAPKFELPPKTSLLGNDHHHHFMAIERQFDSSYDPHQFVEKIDGNEVVFRLSGESWVRGESRVPMLASDIVVADDVALRYQIDLSDLSLAIAHRFMNTINTISKENIEFSVLNEDGGHAYDPKTHYQLRDICIKHRKESGGFVTRLSLSSEDLSIRSIRAIPKMRCGD